MGRHHVSGVEDLLPPLPRSPQEQGVGAVIAGSSKSDRSVGKGKGVTWAKESVFEPSRGQPRGGASGGGSYKKLAKRIGEA
jgi:hypothetical protein